MFNWSTIVENYTNCTGHNVLCTACVLFPKVYISVSIGRFTFMKHESVKIMHECFLLKTDMRAKNHSVPIKNRKISYFGLSFKQMDHHRTFQEWVLKSLGIETSMLLPMKKRLMDVCIFLFHMWQWILIQVMLRAMARSSGSQFIWWLPPHFQIVDLKRNGDPTKIY